MNPEEEAHLLAKKSRAILRAIENVAGVDDPILHETKSILENTLEHGNLVGLRIMSKDLMEWSSVLPRADRVKLNDTLLSLSNGKQIDTQQII